MVIDPVTFVCVTLALQAGAAYAATAYLSWRVRDNAWKSHPFAVFNRLPSAWTRGISPFEAMHHLSKAACRKGTWQNAFESKTWQGYLHRNDGSCLELTLVFSSPAKKDESMILLRWLVESQADDHLLITPEWYCQSVFLSQAEEEVLTQVITESSLNLQSNSYQNAFTAGLTWQLAAGNMISTSQQSQQTTSADFQSISAKHHGLVTIPARFYTKADPSTALELVHKVLANGGSFSEPIAGLLSLKWEASLISDPSLTEQLETSIRFSDYHPFGEASVLDQELVMSWQFQLHPDGSLRINCHWSGPFQQSSGDLIRYLLQRMEEELIAAGASPYLPSWGSSRVSQALGQNQFRQKPPLAALSNKTFWPSLQDYNEAIQNPAICFNDPELKNGDLKLNQLGLPKVATGAFASVYSMQCGEKKYAIRCFNTQVKDQEERYKRTSRFVCSDDLTFTVPLFYEEKGILVKGSWYPILKMQWVEGVSLYEYIDGNYKNKKALLHLREAFKLMMESLKEAGIAHSDLQHGNIIIQNNEIFLVDYDGMFVPELSGFMSNERGHPNYQHPQRNAKHFGPFLDNFSAWAIDTALLCILNDPKLWEEFSGDGESLLFKRSDLENPQDSLLFQTICHHSLQEICLRGRYLTHLLNSPIERIPFLQDGYPELLCDQLEIKPQTATPDYSVSEKATLPDNESETKNTSSGLPDWMT